jgi:hypothetical protein
VRVAEPVAAVETGGTSAAPVRSAVKICATPAVVLVFVVLVLVVLCPVLSVVVLDVVAEDLPRPLRPTASPTIRMISKSTQTPSTIRRLRI